MKGNCVERRDGIERNGIERDGINDSFEKLEKLKKSVLYLKNEIARLRSTPQEFNHFHTQMRFLSGELVDLMHIVQDVRKGSLKQITISFIYVALISAFDALYGCASINRSQKQEVFNDISELYNAYSEFAEVVYWNDGFQTKRELTGTTNCSLRGIRDRDDVEI